MKTLVAGLGNPILGDDGVGWVIADEISRILGDSRPNIVTENIALGGLALMERMVDYDRVILIDALNTGCHPPGYLEILSLDDLEELSHGHSASVHDLSLKNSLAFGRTLGVTLPEDKNIMIVAIEARQISDFSETLTSAVHAAVPSAIQAVIQLLDF